MPSNNRKRYVSGPPPPVPYGGPSPLPLACPPGDDYPTELFSLLEPVEVMQKHGYVTEPLTDEEIKQKGRCRNCNQKVSDLTKNLQKTLQYRLDHADRPQTKGPYKPLPTILRTVGKGCYETIQCTVPCNHHPEALDRYTKCYTCCNSRASESKGCMTTDLHTLREYGPDELDGCYQFYSTPLSHSSPNRSIRPAVAIDCEMGTAITGDRELIRLTAIDYLTGELLINNLVQPDQQMLHLNTKYSGVTWDQMKEARRKRTFLAGKAGAREALWRFVGPLTALIGHGVQNDLRALKWIHPTVVDSYMVESKLVQARRKEQDAVAAATIEAERRLENLALQSEGGAASPVASPTTTSAPDEKAVEGTGDEKKAEPKKKKVKGAGELALKTLVKKYLDRDIQMEGNKGHDSFEDALAVRDLVHWMVMTRLMEKQGLVMKDVSGWAQQTLKRAFYGAST